MLPKTLESECLRVQMDRAKSTMINGLDSRLSKLFLNADNLERDLKATPILDLSQFDIRINANILVDYLTQASRPLKNAVWYSKQKSSPLSRSCD